MHWVTWNRDYEKALIAEVCDKFDRYSSGYNESLGLFVCLEYLDLKLDQLATAAVPWSLFPPQAFGVPTLCPFHRLDSPRRATRRNRPAAGTYEPRTAADLWNNGEGHNPIVTCSGTLNPLSSLGSLECLVGTRSWRKKVGQWATWVLRQILTEGDRDCGVLWAGKWWPQGLVWPFLNLDLLRRKDSGKQWETLGIWGPASASLGLPIIRFLLLFLGQSVCHSRTN